MSYYRITHYDRPNFVPEEGAPRPGGEQRTDTGQWITPLDGQWTDAEAALCGFLPIAETAEPTPGPSEIAEAVVALIDGTPVRQWTLRPMTADEQAARDAMNAGTAARDKLRTDISAATTLTEVKALLVAALDTGTI